MTTNMYTNAAETITSETYTAREFAMIPHNLGRKAMTATTRDGKRFAWDKAAEKWVRYQ